MLDFPANTCWQRCLAWKTSLTSFVGFSSRLCHLYRTFQGVCFAMRSFSGKSKFRPAQLSNQTFFMLSGPSWSGSVSCISEMLMKRLHVDETKHILRCWSIPAFAQSSLLLSASCLVVSCVAKKTLHGRDGSADVKLWHFRLWASAVRLPN